MDKLRLCSICNGSKETLFEKQFKLYLKDLSKEELLKLILDYNLLSNTKLNSYVLCREVYELMNTVDDNYFRIIGSKRKKNELSGKYKKTNKRSLIITMEEIADKYSVSYEYVRKAWYYYYGEIMKTKLLK